METRRYAEEKKAPTSAHDVALIKWTPIQDASSDEDGPTNVSGTEIQFTVRRDYSRLSVHSFSLLQESILTLSSKSADRTASFLNESQVHNRNQSGVVTFSFMDEARSKNAKRCSVGSFQAMDESQIVDERQNSVLPLQVTKKPPEASPLSLPRLVTGNQISVVTSEIKNELHVVEDNPSDAMSFQLSLGNEPIRHCNDTQNSGVSFTISGGNKSAQCPDNPADISHRRGVLEAVLDYLSMPHQAGCLRQFKQYMQTLSTRMSRQEQLHVEDDVVEVSDELVTSLEEMSAVLSSSLLSKSGLSASALSKSGLSVSGLSNKSKLSLSPSALPLSKTSSSSITSARSASSADFVSPSSNVSLLPVQDSSTLSASSHYTSARSDITDRLPVFFQDSPGKDKSFAGFHPLCICVMQETLSEDCSGVSFSSSDRLPQATQPPDDVIQTDDKPPLVPEVHIKQEKGVSCTGTINCVCNACRPPPPSNSHLPGPRSLSDTSFRGDAVGGIHIKTEQQDSFDYEQQTTTAGGESLSVDALRKAVNPDPGNIFAISDPNPVCDSSNADSLILDLDHTGSNTDEEFGAIKTTDTDAGRACQDTRWNRDSFVQKLMESLHDSTVISSDSDSNVSHLQRSQTGVGSPPAQRDDPSNGQLRASPLEQQELPRVDFRRSPLRQSKIRDNTPRRQLFRSVSVQALEEDEAMIQRRLYKSPVLQALHRIDEDGTIQQTDVSLIDEDHNSQLTHVSADCGDPGRPMTHASAHCSDPRRSITSVFPGQNRRLDETTACLRLQADAATAGRHKQRFQPQDLHCSPFSDCSFFTADPSLRKAIEDVCKVLSYSVTDEDGAVSAADGGVETSGTPDTSDQAFSEAEEKGSAKESEKSKGSQCSASSLVSLNHSFQEGDLDIDHPTISSGESSSDNMGQYRLSTCEEEDGDLSISGLGNDFSLLVLTTSPRPQNVSRISSFDKSVLGMDCSSVDGQTSFYKSQNTGERRTPGPAEKLLRKTKKKRDQTTNVYSFVTSGSSIGEGSFTSRPLNLACRQRATAVVDSLLEEAEHSVISSSPCQLSPSLSDSGQQEIVAPETNVTPGVSQMADPILRENTQSSASEMPSADVARRLYCLQDMADGLTAALAPAPSLLTPEASSASQFFPLSPTRPTHLPVYSTKPTQGSALSASIAPVPCLTGSLASARKEDTSVLQTELSSFLADASENKPEEGHPSCPPPVDKMDHGAQTEAVTVPSMVFAKKKVLQVTRKQRVHYPLYKRPAASRRKTVRPRDKHESSKSSFKETDSSDPDTSSCKDLSCFLHSRGQATFTVDGKNQLELATLLSQGSQTSTKKPNAASENSDETVDDGQVTGIDKLLQQLIEKLSQAPGGQSTSLDDNATRQPEGSSVKIPEMLRMDPEGEAGPVNVPQLTQASTGARVKTVTQSQKTVSAKPVPERGVKPELSCVTVNAAGSKAPLSVRFTPELSRVLLNPFSPKVSSNGQCCETDRVKSSVKKLQMKVSDNTPRLSVSDNKAQSAVHEVETIDDLTLVLRPPPGFDNTLDETEELQAGATSIIKPFSSQLIASASILPSGEGSRILSTNSLHPSAESTHLDESQPGCGTKYNWEQSTYLKKIPICPPPPVPEESGPGSDSNSGHPCGNLAGGTSSGGDSSCSSGSGSGGGSSGSGSGSGSSASGSSSADGSSSDTGAGTASGEEVQHTVIYRRIKQQVASASSARYSRRVSIHESSSAPKNRRSLSRGRTNLDASHYENKPRKKAAKSLLQRLSKNLRRCTARQLNTTVGNASVMYLPASSIPIKDDAAATPATAETETASAVPATQNLATQPEEEAREKLETATRPRVLTEDDMGKTIRELEKLQLLHCFPPTGVELAFLVASFLEQDNQRAFYKVSKTKKKQLISLATMCYIRTETQRWGVRLTKSSDSRVPVARDILWLAQLP